MAWGAEGAGICSGLFLVVHGWFHYILIEETMLLVKVLTLLRAVRLLRAAV
jgi:hypothetical protein